MPRADKALYQIKNTGKELVFISCPLGWISTRNDQMKNENSCNNNCLGWHRAGCISNQGF